MCNDFFISFPVAPATITVGYTAAAAAKSPIESASSSHSGPVTPDALSRSQSVAAATAPSVDTAVASQTSGSKGSATPSFEAIRAYQDEWEAAVRFTSKTKRPERPLLPSRAAPPRFVPPPPSFIRHHPGGGGATRSLTVAAQTPPSTASSIAQGVSTKNQPVRLATPLTGAHQHIAVRGGRWWYEPYGVVVVTPSPDGDQATVDSNATPAPWCTA